MIEPNDNLHRRVRDAYMSVESDGDVEAAIATAVTNGVTGLATETFVTDITDAIAATAAQAAGDAADALGALTGTQSGGGGSVYTFSVPILATTDGVYLFTLAGKVARPQNYRIIRSSVVVHSGVGSGAGTQTLVLQKGDGAESEAFTTITAALNLPSLGNNTFQDFVPDPSGNFSTDSQGTPRAPYSVIESGKSLRGQLTITGRSNGLETVAYLHVTVSPEAIPV
jgi:hypothetical protein